MKNYRKTLGILLAVVLLVGGTFLATMAYLTSEDQVKNTFTVGKVAIVLDEAKVDGDGQALPDEDRVKANEYHILPGRVFDKDPTVTVEGGSEDAFVRMFVTIDHLAEFDAIFDPAGADLLAIFGGYDGTEWPYVTEVRDTGDNNIEYEFRYKAVVPGDTDDTVLPALFKTLIVPDWLTNHQLSTINEFQIEVVAQAIQADGFSGDADAAWTAFDTP